MSCLERRRIFWTIFLTTLGLLTLTSALTGAQSWCGDLGEL
jgi:hypothetical protein